MCAGTVVLPNFLKLELTVNKVQYCTYLSHDVFAADALCTVHGAHPRVVTGIVGYNSSGHVHALISAAFLSALSYQLTHSAACGWDKVSSILVGRYAAVKG